MKLYNYKQLVHLAYSLKQLGEWKKQRKRDRRWNSTSIGGGRTGETHMFEYIEVKVKLRRSPCGCRQLIGFR